MLREKKNGGANKDGGANMPRGSAGGDIREERRLLLDAMRGKTIVFVVPDCDMSPVSVLLPPLIVEPLQADAKSRVVGYSELFSGENLQADVLVLRDSRIFGSRMDPLKEALERFRKANPNAVVVVCSLDPDVAERLLPLADSGTIDIVETRLLEDLRLLSKAADVLERRK